MKGLASQAAFATQAILAALCLITQGFAEELRGGEQTTLRLPPREDDRPKVAIVIDDLGLDWRRFEAVDALPLPLTLGFLPYGVHAQAMLDSASPRHEPILHLPMEPRRDKSSAGPDMVSPGPPESIRASLTKNLRKLTGYRGINNHTGSRMTANRAGMTVVLKELAAAELYFLDSGTTGRPVAASLAEDTGAIVLQADLFIDGDQGRRGRPHAERQLDLLVHLARKNGSAIGIGHPYPETLAAIAGWAEDKSAAVRFVTVGELAEEQGFETEAEVSALRF